MVDPDGKQLGVMITEEALRLAQEMGLDLVEVAPNATPPVCRLMDYGKYRYEQAKKAREARKRLEEFVAPLQPPLIHDRYKQLVSEIGEYLKSARGWSVEERREAVALVEALYERFGWAEPGQKSAKRKKQEARKRQRLQALLEDTPRREDP